MASVIATVIRLLFAWACTMSAADLTSACSENRKDGNLWLKMSRVGWQP
jgi:hypothetical protein